MKELKDIIGYNDCLGKDTDGITDISLSAIRRFRDKTLISISIVVHEDPMDLASIFFFKDETYYQASGFSIGYRGEGCVGLAKAIRIFYPEMDAIESIARLDQTKSYTWTPSMGFIEGFF